MFPCPPYGQMISLKKGGIFRIKKTLGYSVSLSDYLPFFIFSLFRPVYFIQILPQTNTPFLAVLFFIFNFSLALLVFVIESYWEAPYQKVFFQALSELVFFYPLAFGVFIFLMVLFYFFALIQGGKSSFQQALTVAGLSSFPLIFVFVPVVTILAIVWWGAYLALGFQKIHRINFYKALLTVAVPLSILMVLMSVVGLLNISWLLNTIVSLL